MSASQLIVVAGLVFASASLVAQTQVEQLEKAIFTEETAGDLDGAIRIYRALLQQPGLSPEVATVARGRLSEGLRRLDVARAATTARTARAQDGTVRFLPPAPAAAAGLAQTQGGGCCGMFSGNYDSARAVTVSGTVFRVEWVNPQSVVYVQGDDGNRWGFTLAAPNILLRGGWNRGTLKPGESLLIYGYLAKGATDGCGGQLPHGCATLIDGSLHASASTITRNGESIFDRLQLEQLEQRAGEQEPPAGDAAVRRAVEQRQHLHR